MYMGLLFLSVFIVYASFSCHFFCSATDRLAAGESISVNQTLVSAGQIFALGFFAPGNSTSDLYAGIWYNRVPRRTVVWVANRENPLRDTSGVLAVTGDGNIAVLDGAGGVVWSTNLSGVPSNTTAVLLDSGNLVLRHGGEGGDLWQGFEHPTDTLLPLMRLRSNLSNGEGLRLTSWRSAADPSPGEFVFTVDPKTSLQPCILKGSEVYWRGTVWDGKPTITYQLGNLTSLYVQSVVKDGDEIYWTFYMVDNSMPGRYVMDHTGRYTFYYWDSTLQNWIPTGSLPIVPCDFYNRCGPSGSCVYTQGSCRCLDGFEPRSPEDWKAGNFTGGCVRGLQLQFDGTDRFVKLGGIKLPDGFSVVWNRSMVRCEAECSASRGCQAYAYANFTTLNGTGSRCLLWLGEMMDLGQVPAFFEDLYVRLPSSELVTNAQTGGSSDNGRKLLLILLPSLAAGVLLLGFACYFLKRRIEEQRKRERTEAVLFGDLSVSNRLVDADSTELPLIDFTTIVAATSNFSAANKLGEGGFGPVYKGTLSQGHEIAVKRLSRGSGQGFQEFKNEVELIARLQHKNLVRLLGWCDHENEKLLIYEFLPNKSLDKFIFDPSRSAELNWSKRLQIIEGIAQGLLYLHCYSRLHVIHRDLKTSNILLDGTMNPKISDFGLARIFGGDQIEAKTSKVVGTYGYMSPEYALHGTFSDKSDVFSFGVIVLEIITGQRSTGFYRYKESLNLLGYAWQLWEEGRPLELVDSSMESSIHAPEVLRCIQLGLLCIQEKAADRPTTTSVVSMLSNENAAMPPPKQPVFAIEKHSTPGTTSSTCSTSKASINELTMSVVEGR